MGRDYEGAADHAQDQGAIRAWDVSREEVEADLRRFFNMSDPNSQGARELIDQTTREAMDQMIRDANGEFYGRRGDMKVYEDRWGNIMGQKGSDLGSRRKIVDSENR